MARVEWTAADMGAAMGAFVEARAKRPRRKNGTVRSEAFHRKGDNLTGLVVYLDKGAWADRNGDRGGAKAFAEIVAGMTLAEFMGRWGPVGSGQPPPPTPAHSERPPATEVRDFWRACVPVPDDDEAAAYCAGRRIDPARIPPNVARVLPRTARVPRWARTRWGSWPATGHRLIVPLYDGQGRAVLLHARAVTDTSGPPSKLSPAGYTTSGTVMACPLARRTLAGDDAARAHLVEATQRKRDSGEGATVAICEGLTSFLALVARVSANGDAPAVFGMMSGGWTAEHASRIPDDVTVCIATDHDEAGEGYAANIAGTFAGRSIELTRWRPPPPAPAPREPQPVEVAELEHMDFVW